MFEKSYNKTVIDFNFGRHKDLSTLKSDIHLGLAAIFSDDNFQYFLIFAQNIDCGYTLEPPQ